MPTAFLDDRALVSVSGPDAEHLLQNVITTDLEKLAQGEAKPGALLTPQGKILFDFLISRNGPEGLLLECRQDIADDLVRRLTLYRLRAKAQIARLDPCLIEVRWDAAPGGDSGAPTAESGPVEDGSAADDRWLADRRFTDATVLRRRAPAGSEKAGDVAEWHAFRVAHGIAESGTDYALGDSFPHDVLLDQNGGVGLRKGCYVGQEVVSRMQHRGTARRRVVIAAGEGALPAAGTEITAFGKAIGTLGTVAEGRGIAIVRIDKAKAAMDAGEPIIAGEVPLTLSIPAWARFEWPQAAAAEEL